MNFVADESVDRQIVERLRDDGHFVPKCLSRLFVQLIHALCINRNKRD